MELLEQKGPRIEIADDSCTAVPDGGSPGIEGGQDSLLPSEERDSADLKSRCHLAARAQQAPVKSCHIR